jgi:hypothetical protein
VGREHAQLFGFGGDLGVEGGEAIGDLPLFGNVVFDLTALVRAFHDCRVAARSVANRSS